MQIFKLFYPLINYIHSQKKRKKKLMEAVLASMRIMIFLMEAVGIHEDYDIPHGSCLGIHVFWLEDAPINTSNTIYMTYTLRKAYHILSNLSVN